MPQALSPSEEPVLRRACDRCHTQKLSCQRNDNEPCARCVKANTKCITSPSLRNRRPRTDPPPSKRRAGRPAIARLETSLSNDSVHNELRDLLQQTARGCHRPQIPIQDSQTTGWMGAGQFPHFHGPSHTDFGDSSLLFDFLDSSILSDSSLTNPLDPRGESVELLFSKSNNTPRSQPEEANSVSWPVFSLPASTELTSHATIPSLQPSTRPNTSPPDDSPCEQLATPARPANRVADRLETNSNQIGPQWLQTIVEINVQLFDLATNSTSTSENSTSRSSADVMNSSADSTTSSVDRHQSQGHGASRNSFDGILLLAQRLLRALCGLYSAVYCDRDPDSSTLGTRWVPPLSLDAGSTLIIMSCYIRLVELLMGKLVVIRDILGEIRGLASSPSGPAGSTSSSASASSLSSLPLPTLSAFTCSLDAFPVLRLRITLELIEHTLDMLRRALVPLVTQCTATSSGSRHNGGAGTMTDVSEKLVLARDEAACELIRDIRRRMRITRRA
ncbi:hypothetical protein F4680DRAFT_307762 [Xylaria scruposa]|nr:hypothetical protein F4680DRAFT_307762 [Xylaria scruposa]